MDKVMDQTNDPSAQIDYKELDTIIENEFSNDKENLIMMLQAIQRTYNYLPRPALDYLAVKIGVPYSKIYGVATFYSTFSQESRRPWASVTAKQLKTSVIHWSRCAASAAAVWGRWLKLMKTCMHVCRRIKSAKFWINTNKRKIRGIDHENPFCG